MALCSCSPLYLTRAVYEESKILLARQEISSVISDPATEATERRKLELVLAARDFAISMGLTPKDSFTKYSRVDRDVLAWVLVGSKRDSFTLYRWWFPIVGWVPYKGFFEAKHARCAANRLEREGFETWVRGTDAFSTLGWFNDPVLSTTLKHDDHTIVETVIHESVHSTIWRPGHVSFNESMAHFIGLEGAIGFFAKALASCEADSSCVDLRQKRFEDLENAKLQKLKQFELALRVDALYQALEQLYSSNHPYEEVLRRREEVFDEHTREYRAKNPNIKIFNGINNAEIMQLKLYLTRLPSFEKLYLQCQNDWSCFIGKLSEITASSSEPFSMLP